MTSFTRKLYEVAPAEAQRIRRQEYRDYRYGKVVPLAQFTPETHHLPFRAATSGSEAQESGYGYGAGLAAPNYTGTGARGADYIQQQFGKREVAPVLPAYECWAPELGKPKSVVRAADSFAARKQFAAHHGIAVSEVAARRRA